MRIVTKTDINIRSGPSMIFEVVGTIDRGKELYSYEYKRDADKIGWYHIDKGWVCSQYVSAAKDADTNNVDDINLRKNAVDTGVIVSDITNGRGIGSTAAGNVARSFFGGSDVNPLDNVLARRIFGMPYQFMESTDARGPGRDSALGIDYLYSMNEAPLISLIPGKAMFLPDVSDSEKTNYMKALFDMMEPLNDAIHITKDTNTKFSDLTKDQLEVRYFGFEPDAQNYNQYVNTLCWMFAIMLGIGNEPVPGATDTKTGVFARYDWSKFRVAQLFAQRATNNPMGMAGGEAASDVAKGAWEKFTEGEGVWDSAQDAYTYLMDHASKEAYYVDFFINPSVSYSESVTNSTSPSMLENVVQGASEMAKELGFLLNAGVAAGNMEESQENLQKAVKGAANGVTGGNGLLNRLVSGVSSIISGANIIFPEIWKSSDYQKSYSVDITLKTPYGSKESIFMDILVPFAHLLCMAIPRQQTVNTYSNPFLVKCFIPGFCSVDMGIIESMSITKGGDGSAWSVDGLPLEMNLNISIKDLYSQLSMSRINFVSPTDIYNFVWNNAFMDYASVQCGLNMKQSEAAKKVAILKAIADNQFDAQYMKGRMKDDIIQQIIQKISGGSSIFGR